MTAERALTLNYEQPEQRLPRLQDVIQKSIDMRWPECKRVNNKSYIDAKSRLKMFADYIGDALAALTFEDASELLQGYLDKRRAAGVSDTTVNNERRVLSATFSWLIRARLVTFRANPAFSTNVFCPAPRVRCKRPLTAVEITQLIAATKESEIYPYIVLCMGAGLRPIGSSRVKRDDLDLNGRTLVVYEKKRERVVPLSQWVVNELTVWLATRKWPSMHFSNISHRLAEIRVLTGLSSHVTMQALRRTFIKKLFDAGVAPQMAASIAGNSLEVIVKHYVQLETMNAKSVVDLLNFGGGG